MSVCWIDSKAMYGDPVTHRSNIDQARSYVNRYGPGVVLYWFGAAVGGDDDVGIIEYGMPEVEGIGDL